MKLSKEQLERLSITSEDSFKHEFPGYTRDFLRKQKALIPTVDESISTDKDLTKLRTAIATLSKKYKQSLSANQLLADEKKALLLLSKKPEPVVIKKTAGTKSEAVPIIQWSDWHLEETVNSSSVNNLNEYNLEIADFRIKNLFNNTLRLINIFKQDVTIKRAVLHLGGDFINGNIHEELIEGNSLLPMDAIIKAQNYLVSGIDFLLNNTKIDLTIVCNSGNHARITLKNRIATEAGNSLEYFMYNTLSQVYKKNTRVKFVIPVGYHAYIDIFGNKCRFHHGHQMRYGGGVGGIYIPVNKSISQWNKGLNADYDFFGHFHQLRDGGNFICNGSLVGFNDYAISIKADFEEPKQSMTLIDSLRGKTIVAPILVDSN